MDITSENLPFYARYFHAASASESNNPFDINPAQSSQFGEELMARINALRASNILRADGNDLLIPIEGRLVLPTSSDSPFPLVMIAHGMARSYFDGPTSTTVLPNQFLSYQGYEVLQNELARHGIASFSVNLNIVNALEANDDDYYQRIELILISFLLLKYVSGETVSVPAGDPTPIKFLLDSGFLSISEALISADTPGGNSALQALQVLKQSLHGKINFSNLGFMGHSRGATAVSRIFEYFYTGTTAGEASAEFGVNIQLNNAIKKLFEYVGKPIKDHVKCIFALQPSQIRCIIESINTMFFVVAGSHDEDVGGHRVTIYESVAAPKVMMYINGATHQRFNYVWRSPAGDRSHVNEMIAGDQTIRVLSNEKHDDISRVVFSSFFRATQKNDLSQFIYFSRNIRYPIRVDIQRAWNFPFPFTSPAEAFKKFDDEIKNVNILNATGSGGPNERLPFNFASIHQYNLNRQRFGENVSLHRLFTHLDFSAFVYLKIRNANTSTLTIPVTIDLTNFSHFGFRFAKWYNVENIEHIRPGTRIEGIPRRVDLRNFSLQLLENDTAVGRKIDGEQITSLLHRAYPTLIFLRTGRRYSWRTDIVLQTVELPISEFRVSNLGSVNKILIELTPEAHKRPDDDDIFVFNDFIVVNRNLSLPTTP